MLTKRAEPLYLRVSFFFRCFFLLPPLFYVSRYIRAPTIIRNECVRSVARVSSSARMRGGPLSFALRCCWSFFPYLSARRALPQCVYDFVSPSFGHRRSISNAVALVDFHLQNIFSIRKQKELAILYKLERSVSIAFISLAEFNIFITRYKFLNYFFVLSYTCH